MKKKIFTTIVGWAIAFIIIFFLTKVFLSHWDRVNDFNWDINYWMAAASIPFTLFSFCWSAYVFYRLLIIQGTKIDFMSVFKVMTIANLGIYVPGKIWGWVGLAYYTKRAGISFTHMGTSVIISQVLNVVLYLMYGSLAFYFIPQFNRFSWITFAAVPLGILFIHPYFINHWLNFLLKLFKRATIMIDFSFTDIIKIGGLCVIGLVSHGIGFALFSNSIFLLPVKGTLLTLFIFPLSYILGYLTILVPGGIGVRESIITYGLGFFMPVYFAIIIAFGYRLFCLIIRIFPTILAIRIRFSDP